MINEVCHINRGISKCIIQERFAEEEDFLSQNRTFKVAVLVGDSKYKKLVALFFYHLKPVSFNSDAFEKLQKVVAQRIRKRSKYPNLNINSIDEYSYCISNVDEAEQIHLQYKIHHWSCKCKMCWIIFYGLMKSHRQV